MDDPLALLPAGAQLLACVAIGLMLAVAGAGKLLALARFRDAVAGYRLVPGALVPVAAIVLVVAEVCIGLALLLPSLRIAALAGAGLLALFAAAIAINLLRGRRDVDCGCNLGAVPQPIGWGLVARNLALAALLLACLVPTPVLPAGVAPVVTLAGIVLWAVTRVFAMLARVPVAAFRRA